MEESLSILQMEMQQGVTGVVLTPHFYAGENNVEDFLCRREKAYRKLISKMPKDFPQLYLGAEVQYFEGIGINPNVSKLCIEGTQLLLLELPMMQWSERNLADVLKLRERQDITVVLAHLDRYFSTQPRYMWMELLNSGMYIQVNTAFFQNIWTRAFAKKLVKNGQIHMLGTDCHSNRHRIPDWSKISPEISAELNPVHMLPKRETVIL